MTAAKRFQTVGDLVSLGEGARAELIDGRIIQKAGAGGEHAARASRFIQQLGMPFDRKQKSDGSGGWWILTEASIHYRKLERVLTPDISGWRRDRVPERPKGYPLTERPDWVCEICHTTRKKDTTIVPETLAAEGVGHYWFVDVEAENLQVFRLVQGGMSLVKSLFRDDGDVRIEPFEQVILNMGVLFGDDPD